MKRLLCIVTGMNAGGAETFMMKIYRNLDKEKYQMDFCVSSPQKGFYDDEIISMGGRILHTVAKSKNPVASFKTLYSIVKENRYNYVMRISQHSLAAMELLAAKLAGAEVRVFRSSNSNTMKGGISRVLHDIFRFLPKKFANVKIAPSIPAAEFMFGKKSVEHGEVLFLNNGIPLKDFSYDESGRKATRKEMGVEDELILGHIGRFTTQKNHQELLEIFKTVTKQCSNAHLMLVGEGELEENIKRRAEELGLAERIHFMGVRKDVASLLSAMDVFVFPSLYEGMPNTVIEAQANGLPCIISDQITKEVVMSENVKMLPLKSVDKWVTAIMQAERVDCKVNQNYLRHRGYDIDTVCDDFVKAVYEKA